MGMERETYRLMLLEGMERDQALLALLSPLMRKQPRLRVALSRFSSGDEKGAIEAASQVWRAMPQAFLEFAPLPELFLVVACAIGTQ